MRIIACIALLHAGIALAQNSVIAPAEHRRGAEQTFLTYPEWFLVHSPAEYAAYVRDHTPTLFPFFGHIRQFWQGYGAVYSATRKDYPFNFGQQPGITTGVLSSDSTNWSVQTYVALRAPRGKRVIRASHCDSAAPHQ